MNELNESLVKRISKLKGEPDWMLEFRLKSLNKFFDTNNPNFGPKIEIDFSKITLCLDLFDLDGFRCLVLLIKWLFKSTFHLILIT